MTADPQPTEKAPAYESITFTRHLGHPITVDHAPARTLINLDALINRLYLEARGDLLMVADQVVYRVTGWDANACALIVELTEDYRPKTDEAPASTKAEPTQP